MTPIIDTRNGWTECIILDNCGFDFFYKAALIAETNLGIVFTGKMDGLDTLCWDFIFNGCQLVLFYNIYEGTTVMPKALKQASSSDNKAVIDFGTLLFDELNRLGYFPKPDF